MQISSPRSKKKPPPRSPSTLPPPSSSHVPTPHTARLNLTVLGWRRLSHSSRPTTTKTNSTAPKKMRTASHKRSPGKHMHWGGVEAPPAYELPQDGEEDFAVEHSPPFSRLFLPATPPMEPEQEVRPECATRLATRRATPPALQKPMRKFEQGIYTVFTLWRTSAGAWHSIYPAQTTGPQLRWGKVLTAKQVQLLKLIGEKMVESGLGSG